MTRARASAKSRRGSIQEKYLPNHPGWYSQWKTARDRNALLQGLLTTTQKFSYAVPVAVIYPVLSLIGFQPRPGAPNTENAILGMTLLFVLAPAALMLTAAWVASRWPLDREAHAQVQAALAAR